MLEAEQEDEEEKDLKDLIGEMELDKEAAAAKRLHLQSRRHLAARYALKYWRSGRVPS